MKWRIYTCAASFALSLLYPGCRLEAQSPGGAVFLESVVKKETGRVEERFPHAKLFQISLYNVVPNSFPDGMMNTASVESSFYVGSTDSIVQAVKGPSSDSSSPDVILTKKSSKREDCKVGYPGLRPNVCAQQLGGLEHEPHVISPDVLQKLPTLLTSFSKNGADGSRPVVLTFATVGRATEIIAHSKENAEVLHALSELSPEQAVMLVTRMNGSGPIFLFNGKNGEFLGSSVNRESHSPPGSRY